MDNILTAMLIGFIGTVVFLAYAIDAKHEAACAFAKGKGYDMGEYCK